MKNSGGEFRRLGRDTEFGSSLWALPDCSGAWSPPRDSKDASLHSVRLPVWERPLEVIGFVTLFQGGAPSEGYVVPRHQCNAEGLSEKMACGEEGLLRFRSCGEVAKVRGGGRTAMANKQACGFGQPRSPGHGPARDGYCRLIFLIPVHCALLGNQVRCSSSGLETRLDAWGHPHDKVTGSGKLLAVFGLLARTPRTPR